MANWVDVPVIDLSDDLSDDLSKSDESHVPKRRRTGEANGTGSNDGGHNGGQNGKELITCAVCLADIEEGEVARTMTCKHAFHSECIGMWLRTKPACPTCRAPQPVEEVPVHAIVLRQVEIFNMITSEQIAIMHNTPHDLNYAQLAQHIQGGLPQGQYVRDMLPMPEDASYTMMGMHAHTWNDRLVCATHLRNDGTVCVAVVIGHH
jgi:Ring finger domain